MAYKGQYHYTAPRDLAYDEEDMPYYSKDGDLSLFKSNSSTLFSGENQTALFLLAMAYARHHKLEPQDLKKRMSNISVNALDLSGGWLVLAGGLADSKDLMSLKDEGPIFKEAERYANAGFKVIKNSILTQGKGFADFLELELLAIAEEFLAEEEEKASLNEEE